MLAFVSFGDAVADSLFEAPLRGGTPEPPRLPEVDSVAVLTGFAPYSAIRDAGDAKIPASIPLGGDGRVACLDIPRLVGGHTGHHTECRRVFGGPRICVEVPDVAAPHVETSGACADYHWDANVAKDGSLSAAHSGDAVQLRQPLHVTGRAGLKGDLAKILSLNGKNFDARLAPSADVKLDMGSDWCPVVKAPPTGQWVQSASVEIVGKNCLSFSLGPLGHRDLCAGPVALDLADVLNKTLDAYRGDIERKAAEAVRCDEVRSKIAAIWRPIAIKVPLGEGDPLYLDIIPKKAAFSGLVAEPEGVRLSVRFNATTSLAPQPVSADLLPLPPLERITVGDGGVRILLSVDVPYDSLKRRVAAELVGREFQRSTPLGDVEAKIDDVDLYASGNSVALGLKVDAHGPTGMLDTTGWVYLSGTPIVADAGRGLMLTDLKYSAVVDNVFWKFAQPLFENEILAELRAHAHVDLGPRIAEVSTKIISAVANAGVAGLTLTASDPRISLASVQVAPTRFLATATFSTKLDATLTGALLGK